MQHYHVVSEKITDLPFSQPKEELRNAVLYMETVEGAIAARNCLHNLQLGNTTILISYESFQPISYLQNMFTKHPRIMVSLTSHSSCDS